jgi:hypothetical protein
MFFEDSKIKTRKEYQKKFKKMVLHEPELL